MKIYVSKVNESWVVDRFREEWITYNKDLITEKIKDSDIISFYMRNNRGIRCVARHFGLPTSYVGALISRYIRENNIRF